MVEKTSEYKLRKILYENNFNKEFLFDSPSSNKILKELFKNSSKNNSGNQGIPDCLYFNNNTLIIMECKSNNLQKAEKDYIHYYNFIKETDYKIYGICFVNENTFSIFEKENKINKLINLETFDIQLKILNNNIIIMEKTIHKIHNYIRDYTKISNEDKPFFICGILIFLKNENNRKILYKIIENEYIYDYIYNSLRNYQLDYSVFEFLRNDESNKHILFISKIINELYLENLNFDLLNLFYNEFVKYNNTDSKSLGIVPTPDHISKIMNLILDIKETDIVLDLCAGTGTLILESGNYTKNIIACEYQNKLFQLLKANFILRDLNVNCLYHGNCFNFEFKVNKSIINPPYGMKGNETELDFILKQLNSLEENGLCCAIIPIGKINCSISKKMLEILKISKIKKIIECNPKLFYPSANVQCCIILFEKNKHGHLKDDLVNIINYIDDEIIHEKHSGKVKSINFQNKFDWIKEEIVNSTNLQTINLTGNFLNKNIMIDINLNEIMKNLKLKKLEEEYKKQINKINNEEFLIKNNPEKIKSYNICDLFEILMDNLLIKKCNDGKIPLISSSLKNNGIVKYINNESYFINCITLTKNGNPGYCFFHDYEFRATSDIFILKSKFSINKKIGLFFGNLIQNSLKNKYNWQNKLNKQKLFLEKINVPMTENNEIDFDYINNFNEIKFKEFKICDLFEILKKPKEKFENKQKVPLICAKNSNNGIKEYIDSNENTFNGNKIVLITGGNGGAGLAFYQKNPFNITSLTYVLSPKFNMSSKFGKFCAGILSLYKNKYSYSNSWSLTKIHNDTIKLPLTKNNEIDFDYYLINLL